MVRRISRFSRLWVAIALVASACGDDTTPNPTTDVAGDTTWNPPSGLGACDPNSATATKSGLTCVDTDVEVTTPEPNPACFVGDNVVTDDGLAYPWGGVTLNGTTYTCNGCPNGLPILQGRFRAHGFKPDSEDFDYSQPDPATDYASILFVEGNTFYVATYDAVAQTTGWSRGYYFCSMRAENGRKFLYWHDLESSEASNVGNWTRSEQILSQNAGNNLLIEIFNSTDPSDGRSVKFPYCRVGSTADGQLCTDPFNL